MVSCNCACTSKSFGLEGLRAACARRARNAVKISALVGFVKNQHLNAVLGNVVEVEPRCCSTGRRRHNVMKVVNLVSVWRQPITPTRRRLKVIGAFIDDWVS